MIALFFHSANAPMLAGESDNEGTPPADSGAAPPVLAQDPVLASPTCAQDTEVADLMRNGVLIAESPSPEPPLALACDGRFLMSVAGIPPRDIAGREIFTGFFLSNEEARFILSRIDSAAAETASLLVARLRNSDATANSPEDHH